MLAREANPPSIATFSGGAVFSIPIAFCALPRLYRGRGGVKRNPCCKSNNGTKWGNPKRPQRQLKPNRRIALNKAFTKSRQASGASERGRTCERSERTQKPYLVSALSATTPKSTDFGARNANNADIASRKASFFYKLPL